MSSNTHREGESTHPGNTLSGDGALGSIRALLGGLKHELATCRGRNNSETAIELPEFGGRVGGRGDEGAG
jgi:hypothetical protein